MYLLLSLWKWVEVLLALLCQLTGTGIMTWGKLLSFLSGIEGEDVNCPSLCVFLYLVYFPWYSQLHSYSQLSVFLARIGTGFWLMLCYNFQAKYQKVCPFISSLTVFRTLTGCVQKYALQTADMASCLGLSTALDTLPGSDILFGSMRSYQNSRSHGTMILLNVSLSCTLLHLHDKVFWKYQHKTLEKVLICRCLMRRVTYPKTIVLGVMSSVPF